METCPFSNMAVSNRLYLYVINENVCVCIVTLCFLSHTSLFVLLHDDDYYYYCDSTIQSRMRMMLLMTRLSWGEFPVTLWERAGSGGSYLVFHSHFEPRVVISTLSISMPTFEWLEEIEVESLFTFDRNFYKGNKTSDEKITNMNLERHPSKNDGLRVWDIVRSAFLKHVEVNDEFGTIFVLHYWTLLRGGVMAGYSTPM